MTVTIVRILNEIFNHDQIDSFLQLTLKGKGEQCTALTITKELKGVGGKNKNNPVNTLNSHQIIFNSTLEFTSLPV